MSKAADFQASWRALPVADLDAIIGSGTCLVLAPHPDDESLGCGGLIATCVSAGRAPLVAILTDGAGSHSGSRAYPPARLRTVRAQEARDAVAALGLPAHRLVFLEQPDTAAPHEGPAFDAVVARLLDLVWQEPRCTAIAAPWRHDPHCDHEAAAKAAAEVAKAAGIRSVAYPVWGWTLPAGTALPGAPGLGWRLDISAFLPDKRRAIQAHRSQFGSLITDDPNAFSLPADLLSIFDSPYETFIMA
ncbi:MAG: PIG-L deacetylase family protein [Rhodopila sp.]